MGYPTNILSRRIVPRIYYSVGYPILNFIPYLLKDMGLGSLLPILYPSIILLRIIYPTGYPISFRLVIYLSIYEKLINVLVDLEATRNIISIVYTRKIYVPLVRKTIFYTIRTIISRKSYRIEYETILL